MDKYMRQRNDLMTALDALLNDNTAKTRKAARALLNRINLDNEAIERMSNHELYQKAFPYGVDASGSSK